MNNFKSPLSLTLAFIMMLVSASAIAGSPESELRNEISFLAKKLLDKSGKNELTIEHPAVKKPFLGICGEPGHHGVLLTCVTPGHNAHKSGLQTGDMITSINAVSMLGQRSGKHDSKKSAYMAMMNKMKADQVLKLILLRQGKEIEKNVTVGVLKQPSYTLIIKRN